MNINLRSQRLLQGYDFLQSQSHAKPIKVMVHEFIQTVVFTPFPQDSELQVERLTLAGTIYESIGFKRKAAFYRRFAALKSVTVESNWQSCYEALLDSLEGFGMTLNPVEYERALGDMYSNVWPGLHVQLLEELITCCKKIKNVQAGTLAIRHMSFLLHTLNFYLPPAKKCDIAKELEEASTIFGEDSPVPLTLANGFVIPTVNLYRYPLCLKLEPMPLALPLQPIRLSQLRRNTITSDSEEKSDNPFIFTPITYSSLNVPNTKRTSSNTVITDINWVQDEPCSTTMVLKNTLPFDLKISSIKLLTDGVPFETDPASLELSSNPDNQHTIQLRGIPRQLSKTTEETEISTNKLEIFGYSTHLLGVRSNCRLDLIPGSKFPCQYTVEISPPLPRLEFQFLDELANTMIDPIPSNQVGSDLVVMKFRSKLSQDKLTTELTVLNCSNVDVEYLYLHERLQNQLENTKLSVTWNDELLDNLGKFPIKAGDKLTLPIEIHRSLDANKDSKLLTTVLMFEFSGGSALKQMFCRRCGIEFTIDSDAAEELPGTKANKSKGVE